MSEESESTRSVPRPGGAMRNETVTIVDGK